MSLPDLPAALSAVFPTAAANAAVVLLWLIPGAAYYAATRRPGLVWPRKRTALWCAGALLGAAVTAGPAASAAHAIFVASMAVHLLVGMVIPLLWVLAAPVTLALKWLPVHASRRVTRILRSSPIRILSHPVTAGLLVTVPLWALYVGGLYSDVVHRPAALALLHLHFLLSGCLFTSAIIGIDPNPHRSGAVVRGTVLLSSIAAHGILAKVLYATPPPGLTPFQAEPGALLMYYGGDAVHAGMLIILGWQLYSAARRRDVRHGVLPAPGRSRPS
ncbi:putative membrane protein [Arthrobacter sp. CAN_A214]|uniref:cytochrome c oxidase assembly protein n=1 Tax=Arthrobacter sp. CAN_A214 TaxID=2787720 RepID=UPI0018C95AFC